MPTVEDRPSTFDQETSPSYNEAVRVAGLLWPRASQDYREGVVELIADLFGVEGECIGARKIQVIADIQRAESQGLLNPNWHPNTSRFAMHVIPYDAEDATWPYQIEIIDNKYLDSDQLPITARAGGGSMQAAFERACDMVEEALATTHRCIFA